MAGRQLRWQSVGRAAAIAAAVIAGIVSLPALLGSDKPPPVPPDVGLAPPPAEAVPAKAPPAAPGPPSEVPGSPPLSAKQAKRGHNRLAGRKPRREHPHPRREHPHPRREHPHPRHHDSQHGVPTPAAPAPPPAYALPPVYSYVPPPSPGEFGIER